MTRTDAGTVIVFEGIDGAGKSQLVAYLAGYLRKAGVTVTVSREPTHGPWGKMLRDSAATGRLSVNEELRLLTEDRREHVRDVILPALSRRETVILDRYFYSTIAYQGSRGGEVDAIAAAMTGEFPIPDVVFLIDVPAEVGLDRISQGRGETPNQFEQLDSLRAARDVFLNLAARHTNILTVDGTQPVEEVRATIVKLLGGRHLPR
jgi:dTMP kinase